MEALNRSEIRKKSFNFWLNFALLIFSTLFIVYFFIWSSHQENKKYMARLQELRDIENTQILLRYKVDSLYWYMGKMAPDQVADHMFLASYIMDQKQSVNNVVVGDTSSFNSYKKLTDRVNEQIQIRDTIITLNNKNSELKRLLDMCAERNSKFRSSLQNINQP